MNNISFTHIVYQNVKSLAHFYLQLPYHHGHLREFPTHHRQQQLSIEAQPKTPKGLIARVSWPKLTRGTPRVNLVVVCLRICLCVYSGSAHLDAIVLRLQLG